MRKRDALLRGGLDESQSNRLVTLLSAMGIEAAAEPDTWGKLAVYIASEDLPAASGLLAEDDSEREEIGSAARLESSAERTAPDLLAQQGWFGRGRAAVFGVAGLCVAVFGAAVRGPEAGTRSRLLELGAISYVQIRTGELWRFLTAVFLHFDIAHLLSNMAALAVIGPPLAHQLGGLRFLVVFLAGGAGANVASHLIAPSAGLKAGASGAIAAALGALGGLALRPHRRTRFKPWQVLGALAAFYGLTIGFGPGRDNVAHVAGLLIGIALGRVMEPQPLRPEIARAVPDQPRSD